MGIREQKVRDVDTKKQGEIKADLEKQDLGIKRERESITQEMRESCKRFKKTAGQADQEMVRILMPFHRCNLLHFPLFAVSLAQVLHKARTQQTVMLTPASVLHNGLLRRRWLLASHCGRIQTAQGRP